jgi:hypothetical protein
MAAFIAVPQHYDTMLWDNATRNAMAHPLLKIAQAAACPLAPPWFRAIS